MPAVYAAIDKSDALFLFWSTTSSRSEWVEKEWKYGLSNGGAGFIRPFVIEGPPIPDPPKELSHLQFGHPMRRAMLWLSAKLRRRNK